MIANFRKLLQGRKRKVLAGLGGSAIAITITALLPSTELSINNSCQISGPIQKLKSGVQGQRYWAKQLQLLDEEVLDLMTRPERIRKEQQMADEKVSEALKKTRQIMEEMYSKYPELRPSPQEIIASELRKRADALEYAGLIEKIKQISAKRISVLSSCRPVILSASQ